MDPSGWSRRLAAMRSRIPCFVFLAACSRSPAPEAAPVQSATVASSAASPSVSAAAPVTSAVPPGTSADGGAKDEKAALLEAQAEQMQLEMLKSLDSNTRSARAPMPIQDAGATLSEVDTNRATVSLGGVTTSPAIPNADRVIASVRPRMRNCYAVGLKDNPSLAGQLAIALTVAANGEVTTATTSPSQGKTFDSRVEGCVRRALRGLPFDPPASAPATLTTTVTFTPTK